MLDARVSDLMLGLFIVIMFSSGMPSMLLWGLVWLTVVDVTDRWLLARQCQRPVRYGRRLPNLLLGMPPPLCATHDPALGSSSSAVASAAAAIVASPCCTLFESLGAVCHVRLLQHCVLRIPIAASYTGVLPWAVAAHAAIGLWMHTRFYGGALPGVQTLADATGSTLGWLARTNVRLRITQVNGIPLLVLLAAHVAMHVLLRLGVHCASGKAFRACMGSSSSHYTAATAQGTTFEQALNAAASTGEDVDGGSDQPQPRLAGTPTYRLAHHPRYKTLLQHAGALHQPLWLRTFGWQRFTRLVSRPGGGFNVCPLLLEHDAAELEQRTSALPAELQAAARQLASSDSGSGQGPPRTPRKSLRPRTSLPAAFLGDPARRGSSVSIAVIANGSWGGQAGGEEPGTPASRAQSHTTIKVGLLQSEDSGAAGGGGSLAARLPSVLAPSESLTTPHSPWPLHVAQLRQDACLPWPSAGREAWPHVNGPFCACSGWGLQGRESPAQGGSTRTQPLPPHNSYCTTLRNGNRASSTCMAYDTIKPPLFCNPRLQRWQSSHRVSLQTVPALLDLHVQRLLRQLPLLLWLLLLQLHAVGCGHRRLLLDNSRWAVTAVVVHFCPRSHQVSQPFHQWVLPHQHPMESSIQQAGGNSSSSSCNTSGRIKPPCHSCRSAGRCHRGGRQEVLAAGAHRMQYPMQ